MEFDPFLLPVCSCGGATFLASCVPSMENYGFDEKTYRCHQCHSQHVVTAKRRKRPMTKDAALSIAGPRGAEPGSARPSRAVGGRKLRCWIIANGTAR